MSRSVLPPNAVRSPIGNNQNLLLDSLILCSESIPVQVFNEVPSIGLFNGIEYLQSKNGGSLYVQPDSDHYELRVKVYRDRLGEFHVKFYYYYEFNPNTHPIVRPYTNDEFEIGDILYNIDPYSNNCIGWIKIANGTNEDWSPFGNY